MSSHPTASPVGGTLPEDTPETADAETFHCPQCGAEMGWDASLKTLECDYCGYHSDPDKVGEIKEYELEAHLQRGGETDHGYGTETRTIQCEQCGAKSAIEAGVTSSECPFCGSNVVLEQETSGDIIRPESLIPFVVGQDVALREYRDWLGRGIFRPGDLRKRAGRGQLYGVYLPFWTFDAEAFSRWRAQAGHYYYESETYTTTENGQRVTKTRQVRRTRWESAWGQHSGSYDDLLIYATNSIDKDILEKIYPFNTQQLVPYSPQYLSGWRAEQYQIGLREAWQIGRHTLESRERDACVQLIPGDTHRDLHVDTTIMDVTFKHVLLPIWVASYPYKGKVYRYMVNGQTGEVQGEKPVSWIRVAIAIAIVLIIIAIVFYFSG